MKRAHWSSWTLRKLSRGTEEIFPFFHYFLQRRRKLKEAQGVGIAIDDGHATETEEELHQALNEERARGSAMDEKTFKMTLSLSFGLTVVGTLSPFLLDRIASAPLRNACGIMIILVVLYAFAGGFVALGAMRTSATYVPTLGRIPKEQTGARRRELLETLHRNQAISIVRHLRNETAYLALRNSFICFSIALTIFTIGLILERWAVVKPSIDISHMTPGQNVHAPVGRQVPSPLGPDAAPAGAVPGRRLLSCGRNRSSRGKNQAPRVRPRKNNR